jgi:rubrerythrin
VARRFDPTNNKTAAPGWTGRKEETVKLDSSDRILDFAIQKEEEAAEFYRSLASKMAHKPMQLVFAGYAQEEMGHKAKLQAVKQGQKLTLSAKNILDLKLGDFLVEPETVRADLTYQEALIIAMKAEKAAFTLYHNLAGTVDNPQTKELFLMLAQEEARHKLRFEIEYDEVILSEN